MDYFGGKPLAINISIRYRKDFGECNVGQSVLQLMG